MRLAQSSAGRPCTSRSRLCPRSLAPQRADAACQQTLRSAEKPRERGDGPGSSTAKPAPKVAAAVANAADLSLPAARRVPSAQRAWDAVSRQLVNGATAALLADVALRAAGGAADPGAWLALASNFVSFLILTSVFVDDQEWEAVICYASGLAGTLLLLLQASLAGQAPLGVALAAAALGGGSLAANTARAAGRLRGGAGGRLWSCWRGVLGCLGWAAVPQVLYQTLVLPACGAAAVPPAAPLGPAAVSLGLGAGLALALLRLGGSGRSDAGSGAAIAAGWSVPAWTATLLFMTEPLAALAAAARSGGPSALAALAPANFLLPALATGLQVPRALLRDHMWCSGTSYATFFACLQAALVAAARGQGCLAAALAATPFLAAACLLAITATVQGQEGPLAPLRQLADGYRREQRPWRRVGLQLAARMRRARWLAARQAAAGPN